MAKNTVKFIVGTRISSLLVALMNANHNQNDYTIFVTYNTHTVGQDSDQDGKWPYSRTAGAIQAWE